MGSNRHGLRVGIRIRISDISFSQTRNTLIVILLDIVLFQSPGLDVFTFRAVDQRMMRTFEAVDQRMMSIAGFLGVRLRLGTLMSK